MITNAQKSNFSAREIALALSRGTEKELSELAERFNDMIDRAISDEQELVVEKLIRTDDSGISYGLAQGQLIGQLIVKYTQPGLTSGMEGHVISPGWMELIILDLDQVQIPIDNAMIDDFFHEAEDFEIGGPRIYNACLNFLKKEGT